MNEKNSNKIDYDYDGIAYTACIHLTCVFGYYQILYLLCVIAASSEANQPWTWTWERWAGNMTAVIRIERHVEGLSLTIQLNLLFFNRCLSSCYYTPSFCTNSRVASSLFLYILYLFFYISHIIISFDGFPSPIKLFLLSPSIISTCFSISADSAPLVRMRCVKCVRTQH